MALGQVQELKRSKVRFVGVAKSKCKRSK